MKIKLPLRMPTRTTGSSPQLQAAAEPTIRRTKDAGRGRTPRSEKAGELTVAINLSTGEIDRPDLITDVEAIRKVVLKPH